MLYFVLLNSVLLNLLCVWILKEVWWCCPERRSDDPDTLSAVVQQLVSRLDRMEASKAGVIMAQYSIIHSYITVQ